MSTMPNSTKLSDSLSSQLAFQRKWQRLSMVAYVTSTFGTLFCSTGAALAASMKQHLVAACLAAAATILIGFEKSMLFREKWKFHLAIATRLSVLQARVDSGQTPVEKAMEEYADILESYAQSLPIAAREGAL